MHKAEVDAVATGVISAPNRVLHTSLSGPRRSQGRKASSREEAKAVVLRPQEGPLNQGPLMIRYIFIVRRPIGHHNADVYFRWTGIAFFAHSCFYTLLFCTYQNESFPLAISYISPPPRFSASPR